MPDPLEKYRIARSAVKPLGPMVYLTDGTSIFAAISDLTADDCTLTMNKHLEVGERLSIEIPGMGRMKAIVRWRARQTHGVHLVAEVAIEMLGLPTGRPLPTTPQKRRWPQLR